MRQAHTLTAVRSELQARARVRGAAPLLIAVDGRSGSGKSTLAQELAADFDAAIVQSDDFFSGGSLAVWSQRSAARRADLCIDWQRLRREALVPLLAGETATWHAFDWDTESELVATSTRLESASFVILDGAFSTRPELLDLVDYAIIATASAGTRRERLGQREGEDYVRDWYPLWCAAEDHYFTQVRRLEDVDAAVSTDAGDAGDREGGSR